MIRFSATTLVILGLVWLLSGCEKPMKNPESVDPIYNDFLEEADKARKAVEVGKKSLEEVEKEIEKLPPRDPARGKTIQTRYRHQKTVEQLQQRALYYEIRAQKRKEHIFEVYPRYFQEKKPWPDKDEWERYQTNKRLQNASRNWGDRVPKPQKAAAAPPKAEKSGAEGSEKGENAAKPASGGH